jgi:hypothetical protein
MVGGLLEDIEDLSQLPYPANLYVFVVLFRFFE